MCHMVTDLSMRLTNSGISSFAEISRWTEFDNTDLPFPLYVKFVQICEKCPTGLSGVSYLLICSQAVDIESSVWEGRLAGCIDWYQTASNKFPFYCEFVCPSETVSPPSILFNLERYPVSQNIPQPPSMLLCMGRL